MVFNDSLFKQKHIILSQNQNLTVKKQFYSFKSIFFLLKNQAKKTSDKFQKVAYLKKPILH